MVKVLEMKWARMGALDLTHDNHMSSQVASHELHQVMVSGSERVKTNM
jgi:hypothetical protein